MKKLLVQQIEKSESGLLRNWKENQKPWWKNCELLLVYHLKMCEIYDWWIYADTALSTDLSHTIISAKLRMAYNLLRIPDLKILPSMVKAKAILKKPNIATALKLEKDKLDLDTTVARMVGVPLKAIGKYKKSKRLGVIEVS